MAIKAEPPFGKLRTCSGTKTRRNQRKPEPRFKVTGIVSLSPMMRRQRKIKILGAFVLSLLSTTVFGEDSAGAPVFVHQTDIRLVDDVERPHFGTIEFRLPLEVAGQIHGRSQDELQEMFPVWVGEVSENPRVIGTYSVQDTLVRFLPRYPVEPNLAYTARIAFGSIHNLLGLKGQPEPDVDVRLILHRERREPTTVVSSVLPSGDVPENLLRFYVYFSSPMSRGGVYEHIYLADYDGCTS
jgi:hypothetical protein